MSAQPKKRRALGRGLDVLLSAKKTAVLRLATQDDDLMIVVLLSEQEHAAVNELQRTGLFGPTVEQVVDGLIRKGLREAILEGWAKREAPRTAQSLRNSVAYLGAPRARRK